MKKLLLLVAALVAAGLVYYGVTQNAATDTPDTDTAMDGAASSAAEDPRVGAADTMLEGRWSSEDDRNFEREYKADGTVVDYYASATGETETKGTWSLFTSIDAPTGATFQLNGTDVYIVQIDDNGAVMYFRIVSVTPTELELISMDNAGAMRFGKLTPGAMRDGIED